MGDKPNRRFSLMVLLCAASTLLNGCVTPAGHQDEPPRMLIAATGHPLEARFAELLRRDLYTRNYLPGTLNDATLRLEVRLSHGTTFAKNTPCQPPCAATPAHVPVTVTVQLFTHCTDCESQLLWTGNAITQLALKEPLRTAQLQKLATIFLSHVGQDSLQFGSLRVSDQAP